MNRWKLASKTAPPAIGIVANDVQNLAKNVKKEFKKLKSPNRRKPRIGLVTGQSTGEGQKAMLGRLRDRSIRR